MNNQDDPLIIVDEEDGAAYELVPPDPEAGAHAGDRPRRTLQMRQIVDGTGEREGRSGE